MSNVAFLNSEKFKTETHLFKKETVELYAFVSEKIKNRMKNEG